MWKLLYASSNFLLVSSLSIEWLVPRLYLHFDMLSPTFFFIPCKKIQWFQSSKVNIHFSNNLITRAKFFPSQQFFFYLEIGYNCWLLNLANMMEGEIFPILTYETLPWRRCKCTLVHCPNKWGFFLHHMWSFFCYCMVKTVQ